MEKTKQVSANGICLKPRTVSRLGATRPLKTVPVLPNDPDPNICFDLGKYHSENSRHSKSSPAEPEGEEKTARLSANGAKKPTLKNQSISLSKSPIKEKPKSFCFATKKDSLYSEHHIKLQQHSPYRRNTNLSQPAADIFSEKICSSSLQCQFLSTKKIFKSALQGPAKPDAKKSLQKALEARPAPGKSKSPTTINLRNYNNSLHAARKLSPFVERRSIKVDYKKNYSKLDTMQQRMFKNLRNTKSTDAFCEWTQAQPRHISVESIKKGDFILPKRNVSIPVATHHLDTLDHEVSAKLIACEDENAHLKTIAERQHLIPPFEKAKVMTKKYGVIEAFAVNTNRGNKRSYNEDRVSILLNAQQKIKKCAGSEFVRNCSLFSIFDGHAGSDCCNYLKDNLHNAILQELDFQANLIESLKNIFEKVDEDYFQHLQKQNQKSSGSCALTLLVLNNLAILINVGDSRAVASFSHGQSVKDLTFDHKPEKPSEFDRIISSGGELYRASTNLKTRLSECYIVQTYDKL